MLLSEVRKYGDNSSTSIELSFHTSGRTAYPSFCVGEYMSKPFARKFYSSWTWRNCREDYAASRGHLCEACLRRGLLTYGEIVHHKTELTPENIDDPSITLDFSNLELLCRQCHAEAHDSRKGSRRFYFGQNGEVIIKEPPVSL